MKPDASSSTSAPHGDAFKPRGIRRANERLSAALRAKAQAGEILDETDAPHKTAGIVLDLAERRALEHRLLRAVTDEQRRIAQELHDGVGQELTALSYLAKRLSQRLQGGNHADAGDAVELARGIPKAMARIRSIVHGLLPLAIGAEDLVPALQALADNVRERTGRCCRFECSGDPRVRDDETAVQLYRIAQEAVGNAVSDASAQNITLSLSAAHGTLTLAIGNDGVGVDREEWGCAGSGVRIMRYRAAAIGASLEIGAHPGGGARVACTLSEG